jgi:hypothetical protein
MSALFGLLTGIPGFLTGLLSYLNKKQDTAAIFNGNAKDATVAIVQAEAARTAALRDVTLSMHSHPVYWIAWGFGVFPVLFYHAAIFFVSTFPVLGWHVDKVPNVELEYAQLVVGSVFTLTGVSTVVAGLAHAWTKRT